ncbi:MAG: ASKHA domain-containing protein [bacterium]
MKQYQVTFYPYNKSIDVPEGGNLLRAAIAADIYITSSCGGNGSCGKCRILLKEGEIKTEVSSKLTREELAAGYHLACLSWVMSDLLVDIPPESRLGDRRILAEPKKEKTDRRMLTPERLSILSQDWCSLPMTEKIFLELEPPSAADNIDDLSRLKRALRLTQGIEEFHPDLSLLQSLAGILRKNEFKVTLTLLRTSQPVRIINIEPGDTRGRHLCVAVDVGTTSIYGQLIDLASGRMAAQASDYNAQIACGEDIISRIVFSQRGDGLKKLQDLVVKTINGIIHRLVAESKVKTEAISYLMIAGNTTMIHLLLGIDPKYIRETPYVPTATLLPAIAASEVNLDLSPGAQAYFLPSVSSYVGGDITAGILGTGIFKEEALTLYVDLGTNGEVVLGNQDWLMTASCSAGPAFEGGGIKHGMRADLGAIEQIKIDDQSLEPVLLTFGHKPPKGICGTGLMDIVAELLETGVINQRGKFNPDLESPRIRKYNRTTEYVLAWADETAIGQDIVITEADIDNLIRAKGAIYGGISVLLEAVGLGVEALDRIIIAGNLGYHVEVHRAVTIGLLPEVPVEKIFFIGNGSLLGASMAAYCRDSYKQSNQIARMMTNVELSDHPGFMDEYISALFLPHTDETRFPQTTARLARRLAKSQ